MRIAGFQVILFIVLLAATAANQASCFAQSPRAARSVHLWYKAPQAVEFYNEVKVEQSTDGSYFMVCGFHHGYFGLQQLRGDRKVILFSVWDPGQQDDPNSVELPRRVEVISHDPAVRVQRFGNEGTGAQSFLDYQWKPGVTYRFLLRAQPGDGHATYAAWFFVPEDGQWKQLAVFRRRTDKPELRGLYSFVEDFRRDGQSPEERRAAVFANGFCRTPGQQWIALTQVTFTADNTPLNNINAAAVGNGFRLATGGQTMQQSALRSVLRRTPVELPPEPAP